MVCLCSRKASVPMGVVNMIMSANMWVGLKDNLYISPGLLAKSNTEQFEIAVRLAKELGLEIASSDDARELLALKGLDKVDFNGLKKGTIALCQMVH